MHIILFVLVGLSFLTLVSGLFVFILACVRKKEMPWLDKQKLKNTPYEKYGDYLEQSYKWLQDHKPQDVYIESYDGLKLHGIWVAAREPKATVLLAHGYRSTPLLDFGAAYDYYYNRGFNLLIPDQRCHGESQGRFITFGVKESRDMVDWIAFHNQRFGELPLLLSGLSMGASTMLFLADRKLPTNVRGIVADCGFTSPRDIIAEVYKNVIRLPAVPTLWAVEFFTRIMAGFRLTQKDTRKILPQSRLPVLMIHGKDDGFVPCKMTEDAYAVCTGPKKLLLVDGADHGLSYVKDPQGYTLALEEFLQNNFGDAL